VGRTAAPLGRSRADAHRSRRPLPPATPAGRSRRPLPPAAPGRIPAGPSKWRWWRQGTINWTLRGLDMARRLPRRPGWG